MAPLLSSTLLRTQSDDRLLALAARGHERAFEAIVERYRRPLHRWCRRVLPEARAEDAVQTTFLKAWTAISSGTEVAELRPWLYRIARNAALDNARKAGYDYDELTGALSLAPTPDDDLERRRVIRETLTGVAGLPDNQREALLRTAAGHSRAEIARELELSEGAVRQLVHRARTTLRAAATAVTPLPFASWAAAMGMDAGGPTAQRIAELAAGAGSAGIASAAIKTGTIVVAAGVLAAGPGTQLRDEVSKSSQAAAASEPSGSSRTTTTEAGDDRGGASGRGRGSQRGDDDGGRGRHGKGSGKSDDDSEHSAEDHSGSGRSGSDDGGDDHSGSSGPGPSGSDDDRSGSSGSGSSGPGSDDSASSGSGSSGSGESGSSGSGSSGSGSGDDGASGSGSSGSGSSGSGSSGSGSSGESSGSGSSGPGSGEPSD